MQTDKEEFQPGITIEREIKTQKIKQEIEINKVTLITCATEFLILILKRSKKKNEKPSKFMQQ